MNIDVQFHIGDMVYIKHDINQDPYMVIGYIVYLKIIYYKLCCGMKDYTALEEEITYSKDQVLSLGV